MKTKKRPSVIILAGLSCVGKSMIAVRVAKRLGFALLQQHDIYHRLANEKGFSRTRYWLAQIGNEQFVRKVVQADISFIKDLGKVSGVVIDASLGPLMNNILRSRLGNIQIITVAVLAKRSLRLGRMIRRQGLSKRKAEKELLFRDGFLEAVGLKNIMRQTDCAVKNEGGIEDVVWRIIQKLEKQDLV